MNHRERRGAPEVSYEQSLVFQNQRRQPRARWEEEYEEEDGSAVEWLTVYCIKRWCGEPVPFSSRLQKREMTYAGINWLGDAMYLCGECGGCRSFGLTLDGTIKETTRDGLLARGVRRVLRPVLGIS